MRKIYKFIFLLKQNEFIRFASVGVANTAIHWGIFLLLILSGTKQSSANLVSFSFSAIFSYFVNSFFTFKKKPAINNFIRFFVVMGMVSLTIGWIAEELSMEPVFTLITTSAASLFLGYLGSRFLIFNGGKLRAN